MILSDEDIRIIEARRALYEAGKSKTFTAEEVKKKIITNLQNENKITQKK